MEFRVSGFGFRNSRFKFGVLGGGFRVSGFWIRIQVSKLRVWGFRVSGFRFWVSGFGFRDSGFGFRVNTCVDARAGRHQHLKCRELWFAFQGSRSRVQGVRFGVWGSGCEVSIEGLGFGVEV